MISPSLPHSEMLECPHGYAVIRMCPVFTESGPSEQSSSCPTSLIGRIDARHLPFLIQILNMACDHGFTTMRIVELESLNSRGTEISDFVALNNKAWTPKPTFLYQFGEL